jgi:hypothetical protein
MRLVPVLLLAAAIAFAGCFGKSDNTNPDDGSGANGNTTVTSTPTIPTGNTTTGTGSTGNTTTAPLPKEVCSIPIDFSTATPSPDASNPTNPFPAISKDCVVPAGYTKLTMNVTWAWTTPAYIGANGLTVTLKDPAKAAVGACTGPDAGAQAPPAACSKPGTALAAGGTYKIEGSGGYGQVTATVKVTAS